MSLEDNVNNKSSGLLKAAGGLGLLLHSAFHLMPLAGLGYLAFGSGTTEHSHEGAGLLHYIIDFSGIAFAIWGIYYAYQGIKELFNYKGRHSHAYGH